jgi:hypothetical protein
MRATVREHLDLTRAEAVARLTGDHRADIRAYDRIHRQIRGMADMLSDGIVDSSPAVPTLSSPGGRASARHPAALAREGRSFERDRGVVADHEDGAPGLAQQLLGHAAECAADPA